MPLLDLFLDRLVSGRAGLTREKYVRLFGPCWLLSGISFFYAVYGFGVWLVPLSKEFCVGYESEARCGVLYPFATGMVIIGIPLTLLPQHLSTLGIRNIYLASLALVSGGVAMLGAAVDTHNMFWLWLGFGVCCGLGGGAMYLMVLTCNALWHKEIGKAGLGGGLMGFTCGAYGALSSLTATPFINAFGLAGLFYFASVMIFVTGLPAAFLLTMPKEWPAASAIMSIEITDASQIENSASTDPPKPLAVASSKEPPLTTRDLLTSSKFWASWLTFFCAFFPGFGIKFLVGTLLEGLYSSSTSVQDISSAVYLGVYAVARLCAGLSIGPNLQPKTLFLFALSIQSVLLFITATFVNWATHGGDWEQYVFVVLETLIGISLAFTKVSFPLMIIYEYGPKNFAVASGGFFSAFCLSSGVAPVTAYLTLTAGSSQTAEAHGSAAWLFFGAIISGGAAIRTKLSQKAED